MMTQEEGLNRIEEIMNWILPGLTMYYRDSHLPKELVEKYRVGSIIRSKTFVDVSGYAAKPTKNTRFIFASSKAAPLYKVNPATAKYQFHAISCESYFKILDVYEAYGVTQVFLMHIPAQAINVMKAILIKIGDRNIESEIIEKARKSLHDKWILPIADNLEDADWVHRTSFPIGLDNKNEFFPLIPVEPLMPMAKPLQSAIKKMTDDNSDLNQSLYKAEQPPVTNINPQKENKPVQKTNKDSFSSSWWKKLFK